uniref:Uncharacterized protein n=1 Tax=Rhodnius prolixus TaxID=13249 RepID=T1IGD6_RHOPR
MLRHWLSAFNSLLLRSCKLPVLEVLVLIATVPFIATLGTALISGWELTPLLLMAIPVKIIVQR